MILVYQPEWNAVFERYRASGVPDTVALQAVVRDFTALHARAARLAWTLGEAA